MDEPASPWRRLGAFAIDLASFLLVFSIVVTAAYPDAGDPNHQLTDSETTGIGLITLGFLTLAFNYFVVAEWRWGQTIGKRILGLRVVPEPGQGLTWNRAVIRNLARAIDLFGGALLMFADERGQRVGDRLAKTLVVRSPEPASAYAAPMHETPPSSMPPPGAVAPSPPDASGGLQGVDWGPARTFAALAIFLVILTLEAGVISAFDSDLDSLGAKLTLQALLAVTLVAVAFAAAKNNGFAPAEALGLRRPLRPYLGPTFAAYGIYIACAIALAALIKPEQEDITRELGLDESTLGAIAAGVLIVLAAPISEEVFFRGFMFAGIRHRAPFAVAAIASAAIWGLFHYTGPDSWGVCLQLAIFGVLLAWLYERTGSILPTIAVHMFNNALAFALLAS